MALGTLLLQEVSSIAAARIVGIGFSMAFQLGK